MSSKNEETRKIFVIPNVFKKIYRANICNTEIRIFVTIKKKKYENQCLQFSKTFAILKKCENAKMRKYDFTTLRPHNFFDVYLLVRKNYKAQTKVLYLIDVKNG